jgi:hypothetical protein
MVPALPVCSLRVVKLTSAGRILRKADKCDLVRGCRSVSQLLDAIREAACKSSGMHQPAAGSESARMAKLDCRPTMSLTASYPWFRFRTDGTPARPKMARTLRRTRCAPAFSGNFDEETSAKQIHLIRSTGRNKPDLDIDVGRDPKKLAGQTTPARSGCVERQEDPRCNL